MNITIEWQKFAKTGKVSDYLNYITSTKETAEIEHKNARDCTKGEYHPRKR